MKTKFTILILVFFFKITAQDISTIAGNGYCCNFQDSIDPLSASLYYPHGVAVNLAGEVFICEFNAIKKINTSGLLVVVAGIGYGGNIGDGGPATAAEISAEGVAIDNQGNIFIDDWDHYVIRKVNSSGIITKYAGQNGVSGYNGDGILAINASLTAPQTVATDNQGNLYVAEPSRIRKINSLGYISTYVGTGATGFSGEGVAATTAKINEPTGLAVDNLGNLYIADWQNDRIRKVNSSGIITTIAGTGVSGYSGDGGLAINAKLNEPSGVAVDNTGNVFFSENNTRIRMINTQGIITTIAGDSLWAFDGDGGPAINAHFKQPWGLATDAVGNLYIADKENYRVRKIINPSVGFHQLDMTEETRIYPNPSNGTFNIKINNQKEELTIYDMNNKLVYSKTLNNSQNLIITDLSNGVYTVRIAKGESFVTKKIVIIN